MVTTLEVRIALAMPTVEDFLVRSTTERRTGAARSDVGEVNARLESNVRILTGVQGDRGNDARRRLTGVPGIRRCWRRLPGLISAMKPMLVLA